MNCKACSTRIPDSSSACPACGASHKRPEFFDRPGSGGASTSSKSERSTLSPSSLAPKKDAPETLDLEEEVAAPASPKKAGRAPRPAAGKRPSRPERRAAPVLFQLDAGQLREIMAEQPELLEGGLEIYEESGDGHAGVGYDTDVGEIEVLCRDEADGWVVLAIHDDASDEDVIAGLLHRIGWVQRHLAKDDEAVRGVLLFDELDERSRYGAAAVADTIEFRRYSVSLRFDREEI